MDTIKILWVDDEIDLLKPHILFLEKKNYEVTTCNNGLDAIGIFEENNFDIVFFQCCDENKIFKNTISIYILITWERNKNKSKIKSYNQ